MSNIQAQVESLIRDAWGDTNGLDNPGVEIECFGGDGADAFIAAPDWFTEPAQEAWADLVQSGRELLSSGGMDTAQEAHWLQLIWYAERRLSEPTNREDQTMTVMPELLQHLLSDLQSREEVETLWLYFDSTPHLANVLIEFMARKHPGVFKQQAGKKWKETRKVSD